MSPTPQQPQLSLAQTSDYRESYANSVQVRVSVWTSNSFLAWPPAIARSGHHPQSPGNLSQPQQAKALWNVLGQNLAQYEQAFGTLNLEPQNQNFPRGPVN